MKRNLFKLLFAALAVSAGMASCKDDGSGSSDYKVPSKLGFYDPLYINVPVEDGKYELTVLKSGETEAVAYLAVSEDVLQEYNASKGTEYEALPANFYSIAPTTLAFTANETRKKVEVTWSEEGIAGLGRDHDYAIAIRLSADEFSGVSDIKNYVIIHPALPAPPVVSMVSAEAAPITPDMARETKDYGASVKLNIPYGTNLTVYYSIDNGLIDAYNAAKGTNYAAAPDGFITIGTASSVVAAGQLSADFGYRADSGVFFEGNVLKEYNVNGYLVPVRITSTSDEAVVIAEGEDVMYIPVTMTPGEIKGPWTVLEGQEHALATDPAREEGGLGDPFYDNYSADRLFDGKWAEAVDGWQSRWASNNTFPMVFVVDMGETHVFTKFRIAEAANYQGSVKNFEIYIAEEYSGSTQWNLAADGLLGSDWTGQVTVYDYPPAGGTFNMVAGRYLKFVILNHQRPVENWTGDYAFGRCKLAEVFGIGF